MFYSAGKSSLKKTGLEGSIAGSWGGYDPVGALTSATVSNGIATSGTFSGFKGDVRNHIESGDDNLKAIGWNTQWKINEWTTTADLSHSQANKKASRYETTAGQAGNTPEAQVGSISWTGFDGKDLSKMKLTSSFDYSNRSQTLLTDADGWGGGVNSPQAGYVALPHARRQSRQRAPDRPPRTELRPSLGSAIRRQLHQAQQGPLAATKAAW